MPSTPPLPELDAAYAAFDEGRYEDALTAADAVLDQDPDDRDAALLHAACVDALGDPEAALQEYEDLCDRFPDDAEIWLHMGELCHDGMDDADMALEAFENALEAATTEGQEDEEIAFEAHLRLVDVCLDLADMEEALEHARSAKTMDPESGDAELSYGRVLFEMGQFEEAQKAAARTVEKDSQNAGGYYLRGMVLERAGDQAGAKESFERAANLEPEVFPVGMEFNPAQLQDVARQAMEELPEKVRDYLKKLKITVEDLPSDADILAGGGQLSPSATAAMKGTPLTEEADVENPFDHLPTALVLYRRNLQRGCKDQEELKEELAVSMIDEVGAFLNLSEDELIPGQDD